MGSVNKVILVGNLGRDAELKFTAGGQAMSRFSLATTEVWNDKGGQKQEKTEWHNIVLWGKQAESLTPYLTKGKQIYVEGRLQMREWEKDLTCEHCRKSLRPCEHCAEPLKQKQRITEVRGDRVVLLSSGGSGRGAAPIDRGDRSEMSGGDTSSNDVSDDDIPF